MSTRRILERGRLSYYHCISRVIEKRFIFDAQWREQFRRLLRQQEAFSGIRVMTWTCLSNHFHVLVAVEDRDGSTVREVMAHLLADDRAFLRCLGNIYTSAALDDLEKLLERIRSGREDASWKQAEIAKIKQPYLDRMYDLSSFVGEIKQRISRWYNLQNERKGPLWEERFKSVLVQGEPGVLTVVAAYIDLNAVRAGLVKDPREWRWCGYSEAAAAQCFAREGVYEVMGESPTASRDGAGWRGVHQRYRRILMEEGTQRCDDSGRVVRKGLTPEEFDAEEARSLALPGGTILRHKVRYFTNGLALGSEAFVDRVFNANKAKLGLKRKVGPRVPREQLGGLRTLIDLRGMDRSVR